MNLDDVKQMDRERSDGSATTAHVLEIAEHGGMLEVDSVRGQARFVHHKLQEYFAARYLDRALVRKVLSSVRLQITYLAHFVV